MIYSKEYKGIEIDVNSRGAEQESLTYKGKEYIRSRDDFWNRKAPILFPTVGRLRDNKTYIDGSLYSMNQHGFARDKEFSLVDETKNSLTFFLKWDEDTLKIYPYKFNLYVTYTIEENKVNVDIKIVNEDEKDLYFNIGGHPGFKLPMEDGLKFEDYTVEYEVEESFDAPTVESNGTLNFNNTIKYENIKKINLNYQLFEIDAIVAPHLNSRSVTLTHDGKGLKFDFYGFNTLAIWTRPGAPFVCLEPWLGYADKCDGDYQYIHKDDIVKLEKEKDYKVGYSIQLLN